MKTRFRKYKLVCSWLSKVFLSISVITFGILLTTCEERFVPEIDPRYEQVLVVDGMITTDPGPYAVTLSFSSTLSDPNMKPASGFDVKIADDTGNQESLFETDPGVYVTAGNDFTGVAGRQYRLEINSPDGKTYHSSYEKMPEPVAIDSVYFEVEYTQINSYPYDLPGYRFYIDAEAATNDSSYFMWQLEETYRYESDYKIFFSYYDRILHQVKDHDTLKTCWKTENVTGFYLMSTAALQVPELTHFPLHYVPTDNRKLSVRYSLFTKQFSLTESAYKYWKSTTEQNTESGDIYTRQLYQIRGNITNVADNTESVFGYFYAAGIDNKRIFVNRPQTPVKMYYSQCALNATDYELYGWMFLGPAPPASNPLYVTEDANGQRALPGQECLDCLLRGGTTEKPEFWIDQ